MEIDLIIDPNNKKVFPKLRKDFKRATLKGVKDAMFYAEGMSKKRFGTPGNLRVVTGRLRASINSKAQIIKNEIIGSVQTDVKYGAKHEFGTHGMPKRPFLKPAIEENLNKINDIILNSIYRGTK